MDKKLLKEILAAHADRLIKGKATSDDYLELVESDEELHRLLRVAERIQSTMQPVVPTQPFGGELKRVRLTTAHLRKVEGYVPPDPARDLFYLLTSIAFIVALGMALFAMRRRSQQV
mgnify:CR=1 FL=1